MSIYNDAKLFNSGLFRLHEGNTYTHKYKATLQDIRNIIRKAIVDGAGKEDVLPFLKTLKAADDKRSKIEKILIRVYTRLIYTLKTVSEGDRTSIATQLGTFDSESDGIGSILFLNLLDAPGSEARAARAVVEFINEL